jgi:hypothetical protein
MIGLTTKQFLFIQQYIAIKNGTQAALAVYSIKGLHPRKIAGVIASQNLRKPAIRDYIDFVISDYSLIETLKRGLDADKPLTTANGTILVPDWNTRFKYLETAFKLKGWIPTSNKKQEPNREPGKITVNFKTHKMR